MRPIRVRRPARGRPTRSRSPLVRIPASDLASTSGIVRTSSGSPAHATAAPTARATAPLTRRAPPSAIPRGRRAGTPARCRAWRAPWVPRALLVQRGSPSSQSSPTATVPAARIASSSSSTRPRYTSSPDATCTSRAHVVASARSVSGGIALVSAHDSSAAYSGERSIALDNSSTGEVLRGTAPMSSRPAPASLRSRGLVSAGLVVGEVIAFRVVEVGESVAPDARVRCCVHLQRFSVRPPLPPRAHRLP